MHEKTVDDVIMDVEKAVPEAVVLVFREETLRAIHVARRGPWIEDAE
ncbi:MAG: hypothetical protein AB1601_06945 [Planctomycetota bacterium]